MTPDPVVESQQTPIPPQLMGPGPVQPPPEPAVAPGQQTAIAHLLAVLGGMHLALVEPKAQTVVMDPQVEVCQHLWLLG